MNNVGPKIRSPDLKESNSAAWLCPNALRNRTRNLHCKGEGERSGILGDFFQEFWQRSFDPVSMEKSFFGVTNRKHSASKEGK